MNIEVVFFNILKNCSIERLQNCRIETGPLRWILKKNGRPYVKSLPLLVKPEINF